MVTIESFTRSMQSDFQPRPGKRTKTPCYRCFPSNIEEVAEFVDHLLIRLWEEPHMTAARNRLNLPLLRHGGFRSDIRGLLKVRRNRRRPIIDVQLEYKTEYNVDLVVNNLEIDFVMAHPFLCIPWMHKGTASIKLVRFSLDFSVYDENITVDQVKLLGMEGLKILELNTGFLMKHYARHRLVELLAKSFEDFAFVFEYNVSKIFNTVLREFLNRAL